MASKEIIWIVKILGIIGAILSGISLLIPWGGIDIMGAGISVYPWGTSIYNPIAVEWDFFNIQTFTTTPITSEGILFGIFMIITFIFALIAFIFGITGVRHIGIKSSSSYLTAGIMGVIAMIMFIIGITQIQTEELSGYRIGYSAGFFLIIVGYILYFVAFGLQKTMIPIAKTTPYQQPIYQQPAYQQPIYQQQTYQQPAYQVPPHQFQQQAPQAQFCPECGTKILPGAKFCSKCGKTF